MNIFSTTGKTGTDFSGKSGYAVKFDEAGDVIVCTAVTDLPIGVVAQVIPQGGDNPDELGIALPGAIVDVKVSGDVTRLQRGYLHSDGSAKAATGSAGEVEFCQFLQDGAADEIVQALILAPIKRA